MYDVCTFLFMLIFSLFTGIIAFHASNENEDDSSENKYISTWIVLVLIGGKIFTILTFAGFVLLISRNCDNKDSFPKCACILVVIYLIYFGLMSLLYWIGLLTRMFDFANLEEQYTNLLGWVFFVIGCLYLIAILFGCICWRFACTDDCGYFAQLEESE